MADLQHLLSWSVHTPNLIREAVEGNPTASILRMPCQIFLGLLADVAGRAIELDDPALNVLMIRLNLYEIEPEDRLSAMERQLDRASLTTEPQP